MFYCTLRVDQGQTRCPDIACDPGQCVMLLNLVTNSCQILGGPSYQICGFLRGEGRLFLDNTNIALWGQDKSLVCGWSLIYCTSRGDPLYNTDSVSKRWLKYEDWQDNFVSRFDVLIRKAGTQYRSLSGWRRKFWCRTIASGINGQATPTIFSHYFTFRFALLLSLRPRSMLCVFGRDAMFMLFLDRKGRQYNYRKIAFRFCSDLEK